MIAKNIGLIEDEVVASSGLAGRGPWGADPAGACAVRAGYQQSQQPLPTAALSHNRKTFFMTERFGIYYCELFTCKKISSRSCDSEEQHGAQVNADEDDVCAGGREGRRAGAPEGWRGGGGGAEYCS